MSEVNDGRRAFIANACKAFAVALAAPALISTAANAADHEGHGAMVGRGGSDGFIIEASAKQRCGTCEFWGGPRRISADKKEITAMGLGWCNNPASHNYQKLTTPDHGMNTWRKWSVLD